MIAAPKGLEALFQVGDDTMSEPVVAFSDSGNAMVVNLETGGLYLVRNQANFVALVWDNPDE